MSIPPETATAGESGRGTRNMEGGTGWPHSPLSPSPLEHSRGTTTGESGGRARRSQRDDGELQGTTTPTRTQGNRSGPDYAVRDYIQGNVVFLRPRINWPYSPISPDSPGPGPLAPPTLVGDRGWMDSQMSGKGKSPVGKKGTNKGAGGKAGKGPTVQPRGKGTKEGGTVNPGEKRKEGGQGAGRRARPRGGELENRTDTRGPHSRGSVATCGRLQETPNVSPKPVGRVNREQGRPTGPVREQGDATLPIAPTPNPPGVTTPLLMDKMDDRAPHKLFDTIKPLTAGRTLSPAEWKRWCQSLDRWTAEAVRHHQTSDCRSHPIPS